MSDRLVNLTIDGVEVNVEPGTLIIRAAEQAGIRIPRFCDHPLLKPVAACRQCLVEVGTPGRDGELRMMPKPQPSCALTVSPGMVVKTQHTSPVADKAQRGVMELLLINHPLDCPICDKGGECPLQNQAMEEGRPNSRFGEAKRTFPKPMKLTSQILLDRDRCILCQRCVRFAREIPGDPFLALQGRGSGSAPTDDHEFQGAQVGAFDGEVLNFHVDQVVAPAQVNLSGPTGETGIASSVYGGKLRESDLDYSGRAFASYFSGNIVQICPVGALTASSYRFHARPFDLASVPGVTEHDASGSAIRVDIRAGEVVRRLAGNDPEVNEEWITDKDRFAFEWSRGEDRLKTPLVRENGELVPTSWSDAIDRVATRMRESRATGKIGFLPGGRLSFEDAWAWSKFARVFAGTNNIDGRWRAYGAEEESFLAARVAGQGLGVTYADVETAGAVLLVGLEPEDECGALFLRLRKGVTAGTTSVWSLAPLATRGSQKLSAKVVSAAPGQEVQAVNAIASGAYADLSTGLANGGVILVGERASLTPGLLQAITELADRVGARLQWVPRRSGERGGIDAGLLPNLLPFGRPVSSDKAREALGWGSIPSTSGLDAAGMIAAAQAGEMDLLVVGGIDLRDWVNPQEARAALQNAGFVVALEVCRTEVTELADVVLPVAPAVEKNGTFINWEGRLRPFGQAFASRALTDRDVLERIAAEADVNLGLRDLAQLYQEVNPLMLWSGTRGITAGKRVAQAQIAPADAAGNSLVLASHKPMLDLGRLQEGAHELAMSARRPVALLAVDEMAKRGFAEDDLIQITGSRGSIILPVESAPVAPGVLWVPECSIGAGIHEDLGQVGEPVEIAAAPELATVSATGEVAL